MALTVQEVMDYVLDNPYNTNPAVLKPLLVELSGANKPVVVPEIVAALYADSGTEHTTENTTALTQIGTALVNGGTAPYTFKGTTFSGVAETTGIIKIYPKQDLQEAQEYSESCTVTDANSKTIKVDIKCNVTQASEAV